MQVVNVTQNGVIVGSRLEIGDNEPYENVLAECERYIIKTYNFRDRLRFVIGDVLNALHTRYEHGSWEQIIPDITELYNGEQGVATLVNWASVCDRVPLSIRTGLSFTHHQNVAYVSKDDCHKFLIEDVDYRTYCQGHNKTGTKIITLQEYLLKIGQDMTARELHQYRMQIIGKSKASKSTPTQTETAFFEVLRETLTYTTNDSFPVEKRLLRANQVLEEILEKYLTD